jgi:hypothetical protein
MNYNIKFIPYDLYLLIKIEGEWPRNDAERIIDEIRNSYVKHGKKFLLIDIREMTSDESVIGDYMEAKTFFKKEFWKVHKIAVLDNISRKTANEFFETTASNRGLRFKFFYNEKDSIEWLTKL